MFGFILKETLGSIKWFVHIFFDLDALFGMLSWGGGVKGSIS